MELQQLFGVTVKIQMAQILSLSSKPLSSCRLPAFSFVQEWNFDKTNSLTTKTK